MAVGFLSACTYAVRVYHHLRFVSDLWSSPVSSTNNDIPEILLKGEVINHYPNLLYPRSEVVGGYTGFTMSVCL